MFQQHLDLINSKFPAVVQSIFDFFKTAGKRGNVYRVHDGAFQRNNTYTFLFDKI